jgi:hypothetical protein
MSKKKKTKKNINLMDLYFQIRGSWNGVNPCTKVFKDKTKYDRKRDKREKERLE